MICGQFNLQLPNKGVFILPIFIGKIVFLAFHFLGFLYVNLYSIYVDFMLAFQNMDELKNCIKTQWSMIGQSYKKKSFKDLNFGEKMISKIIKTYI